MKPLDALRGQLAADLRGREAAGLLRHLSLPGGLDLCSSDYLGYAQDADLRAQVAAAVTREGLGAGSARLLRGHLSLHAEVEAQLAAFCGREAALLFSSGFSANVGLLPALCREGDLILSDSLNHASLIDGMRLSKARRVVYPHADLGALERALQLPRSGRAWVVTESVFSMDGDLSDLKGICDLAERHGALVLVDEAHATGLYGARGSGLVEALGLSERVACTLHTGGKALGSGGAWIAGDRVLIDSLVNHCRSFVFSTAVVPAIAAALCAAASRLPHERSRVAELHAKAAWLRDHLRQGGLDLGASASCIVPVLLGDAHKAVDIAARLQADGFDVRAVRPPTVPEGTSRLRLTVRAPVAQTELLRAADRLIALARS